MTAGTKKTQQTRAPDDLRHLLGDFERSLRAANKSPRTITIYTDSARWLIEFLLAKGMPTAASGVTRDHIETYVAESLERFKPATVSQRYRALAQFFKWLEEEGELRESPMRRMKPPAVPEAPVPVLTESDVRKLLRACEGANFEQRRDTALIRVLLDTGVRAGEIMSLRLEDVDRDMQVITVVGKGRRRRSVPYGHKTAQALDRYIRARLRHPETGLPWLWVGRRGRMTDWGLRQMLERRCDKAGIPHVYPHQFRHTGAHRWLAEGGNEGDLMMLMGWKSPQMLSRYGASAAAERARDAHRRMGLGDRV